jgi:error-prone DNA polymerase
MAAPDYAELFCRSNFSFGLGASTPEELVKRAHALGYAALALVDECSVSGLVRAHSQAKKCGLKLLPGAYFEVPLHTGGCPFGLIALPHDLQAWGDLCQFITRARRSAAKGHYQVIWPDPAWATLAGCEVLLVLPLALSLEAACAITRSARSLLGQGLCLAVTSLLRQEDVLLQHKLSQIADLTGVPLVAAGDVLMHVRSRKPLQDVITAVRCGQAVSACGFPTRCRAWCRWKTPPWPAALRHPVGQGRPRRAGPAQGGRAGPGHAQRHPPLPGAGQCASGRLPGACRTSPRRTRPPTT